MSPDDLRKSIDQHLTALRTKRSMVEALWPVTARLIFSITKDLTNTMNKTHGINYDLYDGSGQTAVRVHAAGICSNIAPRGNTWFNLRYRDPMKNKAPGVADFQKSLEEVMYAMLAQSNFYEWMFEFFHEAAWACTAAGLMQPDPVNKTVTFTKLDTGNFWISEDDFGRVNTLFRRYNMTNGDILKKWPHIDPAHVEGMTNSPYVEREIYHCVRPRVAYDPEDKGNKNYTYESTYWMDGITHFLEEGGYDEFPFLVHRVEREAGTAYGNGPGFQFIRDAQIAQAVAEDLLTADQKMLNPALMVPDSLQERGFETHPGGINWVPPSMIGQPIRAVNESINRPIGVDREAKLHDALDRHFDVKFFLMQTQTDKQMTRAEFLGRQAETFATLQPRFGRATSEVIDQMWAGLIKYADEFGLLPDPPEGMDMNESLEVEYNSPLQTLQKRAHGLAGVESFVQGIGALKQVMPEAAQQINYGLDPLKILDQIGEANGMQTVLTDDKYRKASAEALHQAAVMQAQAKAQMQAMAVAQARPPTQPAPGSLS